MAELKGTQTEKNLLAAFAGESQAFTKYNYYASKAKMAMYRSASCLRKRQTTKRNTQRSGSSCCTVVRCRRQRRI